MCLVPPVCRYQFRPVPHACCKLYWFSWEPQAYCEQYRSSGALTSPVCITSLSSASRLLCAIPFPAQCLLYRYWFCSLPHASCELYWFSRVPQAYREQGALTSPVCITSVSGALRLLCAISFPARCLVPPVNYTGSVGCLWPTVSNTGYPVHSHLLCELPVCPVPHASCMLYWTQSSCSLLVPLVRLLVVAVLHRQAIFQGRCTNGSPAGSTKLLH